MGVLVVMNLVFGMLIAVLAVPMILGRVKPNGWYGFRIPLTMNNPDIWYPANAFAGRYLFWVAVVFVLSAVLLSLVPGISIEVYALSCAGVLLVGMVVLVVRSLAYASRLNREKKRLE